MAAQRFLVLWCLVFCGIAASLEEKYLVPGNSEFVESLRFKRQTTSKQDTNKRGFTSQEKQTILDKHNAYRRKAPAANMLHMSWDKELEALAQGHANNCVWSHSKGTGTGENMHVKTPSYNEEAVVDSWHKEVEDYTYSSNTCASGKACGHYTQVVWAESDAVGCGIRYCFKVEGLSWENVYVTVCNYRPAGNLRGKQPYIKGTACSKCPDGKKTCAEGLCSDGSGQAVTTQKPTTPKPKPTTPKPTTQKPTTPKPTTKQTITATTAGTNKVTTSKTSSATTILTMPTLQLLLIIWCVRVLMVV